MNLRIMILEDDPAMSFFIQALLEDHFELVQARSSLEGWQQITDGPEFDLIILDLSLPEWDGATFLTQLRASEFFGHIPVVVLDNQADKACLGQCIELGVTAVFEKPFNPQKFKNKIQQVLQVSLKSKDACLDN